MQITQQERPAATSAAGDDPDHPAEARTPAADPNEARLRMLEVLEDATVKPIRSIVVDRQMPFVGIRWGADLQGDVPLNGEPQGAAPTFREARLVFYRAMGVRWSAKLQANYNSEGQFEIDDSYLVFTGWETASAKFGIFRPAFGLENLTSRIGLTFMERALPVAALSERRSAGLEVLRRSKTSILHAGLFIDGSDQYGQREKGQAVVVRYVHAPLASRDGKSLGLVGGRGIWSGLSLSYRINSDGPNTSFRSLPEVGTVDDYFVDTGAVAGASTITRVGLEASKVSGPFSWQAEALATRVQRDPGDTVNFYGAYFFASWLLSGETRNYAPGTGQFDNITPYHPLGSEGWGAWEVAARFSMVDLNDGDVIGGQQRDITLGVNWYPTARFRVQANFIKVLEVSRSGSEFDGQDPLIAALRLQWYLP